MCVNLEILVLVTKTSRMKNVNPIKKFLNGNHFPTQKNFDQTTVHILE